MRIGIVGAGEMGRMHARAFLRLEQELAGVYDPDEEAAHKWSSECGAPAHPSLDGLLDARLDALVVASPHGVHAESTVPALERGLPVLIEKPIASRLEDAERIIRAERASDGRAMVGMTHRFYPEVREAKKLVDEGKLGTPFMAVDHISIPAPEFKKWMFDPVLAGGGVFLENAIHSVDRLRWIFEKEVSQVYASCGNAVVGEGAEDHGLAVLLFEGGGMASLVEVVHPSVLECVLEVWGEKGSVRVRTWEGLEVRLGDERRFVRTREEGTGLWAGIEEGVREEDGHFLRFARGEAEAAVGTESAREDLRVVLAVYESSGTGRPVAIERRGAGMQE